MGALGSHEAHSTLHSKHHEHMWGTPETDHSDDGDWLAKMSGCCRSDSKRADSTTTRVVILQMAPDPSKGAQMAHATEHKAHHGKMNVRLAHGHAANTNEQNGAWKRWKSEPVLNSRVATAHNAHSAHHGHHKHGHHKQRHKPKEVPVEEDYLWEPGHGHAHIGHRAHRHTTAQEFLWDEKDLQYDQKALLGAEWRSMRESDAF